MRKKQIQTKLCLLLFLCLSLSQSLQAVLILLHQQEDKLTFKARMSVQLDIRRNIKCTFQLNEWMEVEKQLLQKESLKY